MQTSSIPYKFSTYWGSGAGSSYINNIPATVTGAAASQVLGFPPATDTPIASGGTPPSIKDMNGVLQYLSLWAEWQQGGNAIYYDGTFSTNVGGYPKGATLMASSGLNYWVSLVENNTTNPDSGGANWQKVIFAGFLNSLSLQASNYTAALSDNGALLVAAAITITLPPATGLTNGYTVTVYCANASTTLSPNGSNALWIPGTALTTSSTVLPNAGDFVTVCWDAGNAIWRVVACSGAMGGKTGFNNIQVITLSGTFTVPNGIIKIKVTVVGGGGGVAACAPSGGTFVSGGGGGAGGAAVGIYNTTPGTAYTCTIGAGGAGGTSGGYPGSAGGTTSFGALLSASGGGGATWVTSSSGAGGASGSASGGALNVAGGNGSDGQNSTQLSAGNGGASLLGGGGRAGTAVGVAGQAPGSGGGGAYGATGNGGAGANGIIIVEY